jgi:hypothetical protein
LNGNRWGLAKVISEHGWTMLRQQKNYYICKRFDNFGSEQEKLCKAWEFNYLYKVFFDEKTTTKMKMFQCTV